MVRPCRLALLREAPNILHARTLVFETDHFCSLKDGPEGEERRKAHGTPGSNCDLETTSLKSNCPTVCTGSRQPGQETRGIENGKFFGS